MASGPRTGFRWPFWRFSVLVAALGLASGFLLTRTGLRSADSPAGPTPPASVFTRVEPARNPERLTLLADEHKVVGWISGASDHAGDEVSVRMGAQTDKVKIEAGNVFSWKFKTAKPARVEVRFGKLKQTVTVQPADKPPLPNVFFLTDRHVYRPGQTLHVAGFLRQLTERGDFVPLSGKNVEVALKTERKGTVVQRWKVTSDDLGRFTADYRFVDADPLDNYELSIPEYQGKLQVNLAEYRKSKVQLKIAAEQKGGEVKLRFAAVDPMDRPLPAQKVSFTAQVVRTPPLPPSQGLKGEDFAHARNTHWLTPQWTDLSDEEQLLLRGDPSFDPTWATGLVQAPVAAIKGEVNLAGKATGDFGLKVPRTCQQPGHAVTVEAILLDASNREVRHTQTFPLTFLSDRLKLQLARDVYDIDEPIKVRLTTLEGKKVEGTATLVAMRLTQVPVGAWGFAGGQLGMMGMVGFGGQLGMMGNLGGANFGFGCQGNPFMTQGRWQTMQPPDSVKRTLATATTFKEDTATLKLGEPGAYKLIAIVERPEGGKWQQEIGCLVQPHKERTGVSLQLDRSRFKSGEPLTGILHSRFANARVLLTVRDSQGLRLFRTLITDKAGRAVLKEALPADMRYGCVVTAQYADGPALGDLHIATRTFHVEPTDRMLVIETKTKPVYGPSDTVTLDIKVNRKEPVDLIVSVYDQTLTHIKPTQTADICSFYLADERAFSEQGRDVLQRRLAGVTIDSLLKRARQLTKDVRPRDEKEEPSSEDLQLAAYTDLLQNARTYEFSLSNVVTLLQLAGIKVRLISLNEQLVWSIEPSRRATVMDLLNEALSGHSIHLDSSVVYVGLLQDTFYLMPYEPGQPITNPGNLSFRAFNGMNMFGPQPGMGGIGMMGMVGVVGGIGQLGASVLPMGRPAMPLLGADPDQKDLFVRRDFSDSAYWNAKVRTDAQGKARVEFKVPDSLTAWQVVVTGVTRNMHVGQAATAFQVDKPIMICPMLPRIFTEGDKTKVLGQVVNGGKTRQTMRVRLKVENGAVLDRPEREVTLEAGAAEMVYWTFKPGKAGFTQLLMSVESPAGSDASLKRLPVVRAAVEEAVTKSGFCKEPAVIEVPEGVDPATAQLEIRLAPTLMADLVDTLDYLVDYPYGCAEQTMSRFLPAIKVAQVLQHFEIDNPALKQKLPGCVAGGIKRLLELQQNDGGWGWNGNAVTHEMMTPYVLYGLLEAEKAGYNLGSEDALAKGMNRLHQFIVNLKQQIVNLKQQNAAAARNWRKLINDNDRETKTVTTQTFTTDWIFCMYVYGQRNKIEADWWTAIAAHLENDDLSDQALALALQMAVQHKNDQLAPQLAEKLRKRAVQQQGLVHWNSAGFSRWHDDPLEITATALKALVMYDAGDALVPKILQYFSATKRGNRWNSTKDTAMIVEALCDFLAKQQLNAAEKPQLTLKINGGAAREIVFGNKGLVEKIFVPGKDLRKGANTVAFPEGTQGVMYRLILRHTVSGQDIPAKDQGLTVARSYWLLDAKGKRVWELKQGDTVPRGSYLECEVNAGQKAVDGMNYVLLENPRPSCCEFIPEDDRRFTQQDAMCVLREERETHLACHYERTTNQLRNTCVMLAEVAGEFVVPPARVELMYQTEIRGHSGTFRFKVAEQ